MNRPKLLDLFCCAGGAAMGYHRAGFDVVGVDLNPQPRYPFTFAHEDALGLLRHLVNGDEYLPLHLTLSDFDAVHASPPCQRHSAMSACRPGLADSYPDLVAETRDLLEETGLPYVIENVVGAPLRADAVLCGQMFGLELYRHRLFEANFPIEAPAHPAHVMPASRAGHWTPGTVMSVAGNVAPVAHARKIMGIDWTNRRELGEAIPPAYTEHIGAQILEHLRATEAA